MRKNPFKTSFRDYTHAVYCKPFQRQPRFSISPKKLENSSTFKPSEPSRLRPSRDPTFKFPELCELLTVQRIFFGWYRRFLVSSLSERSYFDVTATFAGKLAETSILRNAIPAFFYPYGYNCLNTTLIIAFIEIVYIFVFSLRIFLLSSV